MNPWRSCEGYVSAMGFANEKLRECHMKVMFWTVSKNWVNSYVTVMWRLCGLRYLHCHIHYSLSHICIDSDLIIHQRMLFCCLCLFFCAIPCSIKLACVPRIEHGLDALHMFINTSSAEVAGRDTQQLCDTSLCASMDMHGPFLVYM